MKRLENKVVAASQRLESSFWAIPALVVLGAVGLSYLAEWVDSLLPEKETAWYLFRGGPESARSVLQTIAGSMMTFTGLVFSVTILVLQLASTQFSPRALKAFLGDTVSKLTLGVFVGTFVYALLTLRAVRGTSEEIEIKAFVPSLSIWLAVILVMLCVATFIGYIHHVAQSIRPTVVLGRIAARARESLEDLYPEHIGDDLEDPRPVPPSREPDLIVPNPHRSGVVERIDEEALLEAVDACAGDSSEENADVFVSLRAMPGDFVLEGAPLFDLWGAVGDVAVKRLTDAVLLGRDRNVSQDAAFGLRELIDVALRALSPSTNDPTTAVMAIHQLHDLLRKLVRRRFPSSLRRTRKGRLVLIPRPDFHAYVRLAMDELRLCGTGHFQIARRLHAMLDDLLLVAPPFRREELLRQKALLNRAIDRDFADELDRPAARQPDPRGH